MNFNDITMGRIPKFEKTTAIYPKLEVQKYCWITPFKECVDKHKPDEITLRVSTILDGTCYNEDFTIVVGVNDIPEYIVLGHLQKLLNETIKRQLVNIS